MRESSKNRLLPARTGPHRGKVYALSRVQSLLTFSLRSTGLQFSKRKGRRDWEYINTGEQGNSHRKRGVQSMARWNSSHKSCTTHTYFRHIGERMRSRWIRQSYHCTQALTGAFGSYLQERQIAEDETCSCSADKGTVVHFLLECQCSTHKGGFAGHCSSWEVEVA